MSSGESAEIDKGIQLAELEYPANKDSEEDESEHSSESMRHKMKSKKSPSGGFELLKKNWFMVGVVFVIGFANVAPWLGKKHGPLRPEYTVSYGSVFFIFMNSGLGLKVSELSEALSRINFQALLLGFNMLGVPIIMYCITWHLKWFFGDLLEKSILDGFLVLSCMPPPVSSAVVLTRAVDGNDAAAVCASAMGSFLGLVVTPLSLLFWTGMETTADISKTVMKLGMTVVLPIILGQVIRGSFGPTLDRMQIPHSKISNILLLSIIYSTFCDTFDEEVAVSSGSLVFIIFFTIFFQGLILILILTSAPIVNSNIMELKPKDVMCTLFVCSHKSLTMGFPLLKLMYSGKPELSLVSIPLLVYHPTQILLGSILSPYFRQWRINAETYGSYFVVNTAEGKEDEGFEII